MPILYSIDYEVDVLVLKRRMYQYRTVGVPLMNIMTCPTLAIHYLHSKIVNIH